MRLVEFKRLDSRRFMAMFEQDGERIGKTVRVGDGEPDAEIRYALVRKAREAVRDFAFEKHGPEDWKKHVNWGEFFDAPTDAEKQMIEDGLRGA